MLFARPFGNRVFGKVPNALSASTPDQMLALLADEDATIIYLLEAQPKSVNASTLVSTTQRVYLSNQEFETEPGDTPANQQYLPRLVNPFNFQSSIPFDGRAGRGSAAFGIIEIANADGKYDALLDYAWAGEPLEIKIGGIYNLGRYGQVRLTYPYYGRLFYGTAAGVSGTRQSIQLQTRDPAQRLAVPVQTTVYAGTGGKEGGTNLAGRPKPLGYGVFRQAPVVLIDSANLVYQAHDGVMSAFLDVQDAGFSLTFDADYASYAALIAATIPSGRYATCLAEGMLRLGAKAAGLVTVDGQGDASTDAFTTGYTSNTAGLVRRIATTRGSSPLADPAEIESSAFNALPTQTNGVWIGTESRTLDSVLDELMGSIGGWWTFTRNGLLTVGVVAAASNAMVTVDTVKIGIGTLQRVPSPEPVWRVTLGYKKFYATQAPSALNASLTADQVDSYGKQYRFVVSDSVQGAAVQAAYPQARDLLVLTNLDDATQAQAECDRLFALHKVKRGLWRARNVRQLYQHRVGQSVRLEHDRFGLSAGIECMVVELAEVAADRAADLILWG